ncbi:hypothetical protein CK203_115252 [Vitis vinifera]|uniref:Uncharacterized protein n=1 Tax=Vitis vinifera TaxID=29760 RepID=A0A438CBJ6_VITVI|nr:hypothetical protein CK203_115252 [Vitis vinifera]
MRIVTATLGISGWGQGPPEIDSSIWKKISSKTRQRGLIPKYDGPFEPYHEDLDAERVQTKRAPPLVMKEFDQVEATWERDVTLWQFETAVQAYWQTKSTRASTSVGKGGEILEVWWFKLQEPCEETMGEPDTHSAHTTGEPDAHREQARHASRAHHGRARCAPRAGQMHTASRLNAHHARTVGELDMHRVTQRRESPREALTAPRWHHGTALGVPKTHDATRACTHGFHDMCGVHPVAVTARGMVRPTPPRADTRAPKPCALTRTKFPTHSIGELCPVHQEGLAMGVMPWLVAGKLGNAWSDGWGILPGLEGLDQRHVDRHPVIRGTLRGRGRLVRGLTNSLASKT